MGKYEAGVAGGADSALKAAEDDPGDGLRTAEEPGMDFVSLLPWWAVLHWATEMNPTAPALGLMLVIITAGQ